MSVGHPAPRRRRVASPLRGGVCGSRVVAVAARVDRVDRGSTLIGRVGCVAVAVTTATAAAAVAVDAAVDAARRAVIC